MWMDPSVDRSIHGAPGGASTRARFAQVLFCGLDAAVVSIVFLSCVFSFILCFSFSPSAFASQPSLVCLFVHVKISTKGFHRVALRFSRLRSNVKFISHLSESDRCELFLYVVISDQQVGATAQPSVCSIFCCFFVDRSVWLLTCAPVLFSARPGVVATWQHCCFLHRAARRSCNLATLSPHALRSGGRFLQISMRFFHF